MKKINLMSIALIFSLFLNSFFYFGYVEKTTQNKHQEKQVETISKIQECTGKVTEVTLGIRSYAVVVGKNSESEIIIFETQNMSLIDYAANKKGLNREIKIYYSNSSGKPILKSWEIISN